MLLWSFLSFGSHLEICNPCSCTIYNHNRSINRSSSWAEHVCYSSFRHQHLSAVNRLFFFPSRAETWSRVSGSFPDSRRYKVCNWHVSVTFLTFLYWNVPLFLRKRQDCTKLTVKNKMFKIKVQISGRLSAKACIPVINWTVEVISFTPIRNLACRVLKPSYSQTVQAFASKSYCIRPICIDFISASNSNSNGRS